MTDRFTELQETFLYQDDSRRNTEISPSGGLSKSRPTTVRNDFARTTIAPVRRKTMAENEKFEFFRNLGSVS